MDGKSTARQARRRAIGDVLLVTGIVLVAVVAFLLIKYTSPRGNVLEVILDGECVARYSLSEDTEEEIVTEYGSNTLVITGGKAEVVSSDCPDLICVGHRAIENDGESIVCLPHRLVFKIALDTDLHDAAD